MISIKKAIRRIIASFAKMGTVSKTIIKIAIVLFMFLAVPSIVGIAVFANSTPNPRFLFLCESALEVAGQVIAFGFIGGIVMNAAFQK